MSEERTTIFEARVGANHGSFFIDARQAKNDHYYLTITDSRKKEDNTFEQTRIFVFDDSIKQFHEKVSEACDILEKLTDEKREKEITEARKTNPKAFMKWNPEEEEKLEKEFKKGVDIEALTKAFGRSSGALLARLERMGLIEPEAAKA